MIPSRPSERMTFPVKAILIAVGLSVSISNVAPMLALPSLRTYTTILCSHEVSHQSTVPGESSQETSEGELLEEVCHPISSQSINQ